jgi:hypothetical protein
LANQAAWTLASRFQSRNCRHRVIKVAASAADLGGITPSSADLPALSSSGLTVSAKAMNLAWAKASPTKSCAGASFRGRDG